MNGIALSVLNVTQNVSSSGRSQQPCKTRERVTLTPRLFFLFHNDHLTRCRSGTLEHRVRYWTSVFDHKSLKLSVHPFILFLALTWDQVILSNVGLPAWPPTVSPTSWTRPPIISYHIQPFLPSFSAGERREVVTDLQDSRVVSLPLLSDPQKKKEEERCCDMKLLPDELVINTDRKHE